MSVGLKHHIYFLLDDVLLLKYFRYYILNHYNELVDPMTCVVHLVWRPNVV